eukprot:3547540-Prymnesium_polylepis.1
MRRRGRRAAGGVRGRWRRWPRRAAGGQRCPCAGRQYSIVAVARRHIALACRAVELVAVRVAARLEPEDPRDRSRTRRSGRPSSRQRRRTSPSHFRTCLLYTSPSPRDAHES